MWWPVMAILTRVHVGGVNNFAAVPLYGFTILLVKVFIWDLIKVLFDFHQKVKV